MTNSSKYQISHVVVWLDNLGRYVATYKSGVYPIKNDYVVPDSHVHSDKGEPLSLAYAAEDVLDMNFWFLCFQYEQKLKVSVAQMENTQSTPNVEGPANAYQ